MIVVQSIALLACCKLCGKPVVKSDPVNPNYLEWQGMSAKTYIKGRELVPSDLRHKVVVVVDVEPNDKLQLQLALAGNFVIKAGYSTVAADGCNWETLELPRDMIVVISNRGGGRAKDHEAIVAALKYKGDDPLIAAPLGQVNTQGCSLYDDITFPGSPDTSGKRPYVYVMGHEGKEPIFQDVLTDASVKKAKDAINRGLAKVKEQGDWKAFYGTIEEPKYFPIVAKTVEKGKPLAPIEKALLKDVVAKDEEKAREAQILYDALCQTRSDLIMRIRWEIGACPHRAYYDLQQLLRFWPSEKKRLEEQANRIKQNPEMFKLSQMFCKVMVWADPDFTCKNAGEAKKIVGELKKIKKDLEKLKESKIVVVQNGALLMDVKVDELIDAMPLRLPVQN